MDKSSLGTRMKGYESVPQLKLIRRTPVIIRIDGRAFHTFTKGMDRPFDDKLSTCMVETTKALVDNVENCVFGYTQSDEISLLLIDYNKLETQAWFDNKVQKIVSISSSIATAHFNIAQQVLFNGKINKLAMFDARVFNIPKEEVYNYFIWRQQDCTRNSVQMVGRANFSHKELHKKSCSDIQEMLFQAKGINWNDTSTKYKRGVGVYKKQFVYCNKCKWKTYNFLKDYDLVPCPKCKNLNVSIRTEIYIDNEIPIFTQDRDFIQRFVDV